MTDGLISPVAVIAGRGHLPRHTRDALVQRGIDHRVLALEGIFDDNSLACDASIRWDKWKQIGQFLQQHGIRSVVFVGKVDRPRLSDLRPDGLLARYLPKLGLAGGGDDAVIRKVGATFQELFNVTIIDPYQLLHSQGLSRGAWGKHAPGDQDLEDIARGRQVLDILSQADFGQSVVIDQGRVLGVEALEGTDRLIERIHALKDCQRGGVLVKMLKKHQDPKLDPPVIGLATLKVAHASGLHGIAIDQRGTIVIDSDTIRAFADQKNMFIYAF